MNSSVSSERARCVSTRWTRPFGRLVEPFGTPPHSLPSSSYLVLVRVGEVR